MARHVRAVGRVQGVFFRAWTREQAARLEVGGWVRNCPDGTVEAWVEGEAEAIEQMIAAMRRGPRGARVEDTKIEAREPSGAKGFEVRH